jgi:hypothetical protein
LQVSNFDLTGKPMPLSCLPQRRRRRVPHTCALSWTDSAERQKNGCPDCDQVKEPQLMQVTRITANLSVPDIGEARDFYVDYLGLSVEGFNMGWVRSK